MKGLVLALQFLTIIPIDIKKIKTKHIAQSMIFFPLAGLFLGSVLIIANSIMEFLGFGAWASSVLLVVLLIIITGGLHMDGLADTIDALGSRKNKEAMLEIMRDSRTGAMGVLGIVCAVLIKIALLYSLNIFLRPYALILMCVLSRWVLVLEMYAFAYARQEGKAKNFIECASLRIFIWTSLVTLISIFIIGGLKTIIIMAVVAILGYILGIIFSKKIGGITGDTLGATNEIMEITTMIAVLAVQKGWLL